MTDIQKRRTQRVRNDLETLAKHRLSMAHQYWRRLSIEPIEGCNDQVRVRYERCYSSQKIFDEINAVPSTQGQDLRPLLSDEEQILFITVFQMFLQLPNAEELSLSFLADTSCSLRDSSNKLVEHWHDIEEAVSGISIYAQSFSKEKEMEG